MPILDIIIIRLSAVSGERSDPCKGAKKRGWLVSINGLEKWLVSPHYITNPDNVTIRETSTIKRPQKLRHPKKGGQPKK